MMKTKTKQILDILKVVSWITFFGLCIQTGTIIFTFIYSFFNPSVAQNLDSGLNLSNLYNTNIGMYSYIVSCLIVLSGLKSYIFFLVIKIFQKVDFKNPFKIKLSSLIERISYFAFAVWALSIISNNTTNELIKKGIEISGMHLQKYIGGSSEFFFLGLIVFVISQIFKRGIELQSENDLTI